VIRSLEVGSLVCRNSVLEEAQSGEKTLAGRGSQRLVEGPGAVLIESRGTVAFCFANFKQSCACTVLYSTSCKTGLGTKRNPIGGFRWDDVQNNKGCNDPDAIGKQAGSDIISVLALMALTYSLMIVDEYGMLSGIGRRLSDGGEEDEGRTR
jgi:hypothetical protein